MQESGLLFVLLVVAVLAAIWFRRRPLTSRQRVIAVGVAIGLLGYEFLVRGQADWGKVAFVAAGSAVLIMAAWFVKRSQDNGPQQ